MSVLSKTDILAEMKKKDDPLVVSPLLEESQIGEASIDMRLGHQFIILRKSSVPRIDPTEVGHLAAESDWETALHRSQERIRIASFHEFVLHPGQLVLGATLEYLSIPQVLCASVEGRSSWGRLGLIIATASTIGPGFKGCVTLELVNSGEVPLIVYPGIRIAQVIFQKLSSPAKYAGKYDCPIGPQFSRAHLDKELAIWGRSTTKQP